MTSSKFITNTGISSSFCIPRGKLKQAEHVCLRMAGGDKIPAQFWPLAFWPDHSIKWMGVAFLANSSTKGSLIITKEKPKRSKCNISVRKSKDKININTGTMRLSVPCKGHGIIDQLSILKNNSWIKKVNRKNPVYLFSQRARVKETASKKQVEHCKFEDVINSVEIEQKGPVRAVVKINGTHRQGKETFLPFSIRMYLYSQCNSIRIVHTFFYDGESERDFISGLGIRFPIECNDPAYNRHVFVAEDSDLWHEPVNILPQHEPIYQGWADKGASRKKENTGYKKQYEMQYLSKGPGAEFTPVWNNYSLYQDSSEHFSIEKATSSNFGAIIAKHGRRSQGWACINTPQGGLSVGIKDFWQAYPGAINIENAGATNKPIIVSAELWPSRGEALDLRHYSDEIHGPNYESGGTKQKGVCLDWVKSKSPAFAGNPYGIGRTSEITFQVMTGDEKKDMLKSQMQHTSSPPLYLCPKETYAAARVFSPWSITGKKKLLKPLEDKLAEIIDFMVHQVDKYSWYGFIDYGDFQMVYDEIKKNWKYDEGGNAWINEELMPGIFLWQCFLRTGRLDLYRLSEAMSRHGEVDMFHIGPLRGLGTRHNVKHWGCSNHEIRQSMAGYKRYFHLLSGDERARDIIIGELPDTGKAIVYLQKIRKGKRNLPEDEITASLGPGLSSFFWNWLTLWEFTGLKKYEKIVTKGIEYMAKQKQPHGLAGRSMSYKINYRTGKLTLLPHLGKPPMANIFGSTQIWLELAILLKSKEWNNTLCKYGLMHLVDTYAERKKMAPEATGQGSGLEDIVVASGGNEMIAFAGSFKKNRKIMQRAVEKLLSGISWRAITENADNRRFANWGRQAIAVIALLS